MPTRNKSLPLVVLLGALAAVSALAFWKSAPSPTFNSQAEAAEAAPQGDGVVARVGDIAITEAEVREAMASELQGLEQQRFQIYEQGVERVVTERVLALEAEKRGVTVDEMVEDEVEKRAALPTDAAVDAFYEARKDQIDQPKEAIAPRIREFLLQQARQEAYGELVGELKRTYGVVSLLEPFRVQVASAGAPALGPTDAPVTIVEFSDFECPFCSRIVPTLEEVKKTYGDKVRLVFRHFPLLSIHPNAQKAAEASMCAHEQERFWDMHDTLFQEQKALGVEQLKQKAVRLELDAERFNECLDSSRYAELVAADLEAGSEAGVTGTPALFINGRFLSGAQPYEAIARIIDDELERAGR